jgi:hypothetical protein
MANEKISQLTPHTPNAADVIPVADGGVNFSDTVGAIESQAAALVVNITGTAVNLSGTPALPNGTTATTQITGDNTTKIATDAFVHASIAALPAETWSGLTGNLTETQVVPFDGPTPGTADTWISRSAAGTVAIGATSTPGDASGILVLANLELNSSTPTYLSGGYAGGHILTVGSTAGGEDGAFLANEYFFRSGGSSTGFWDGGANGLYFGDATPIGWTANSQAAGYTPDTSISRASANVIQIGSTGGTPDASGTLKLAKVSIVSAGAPTNAATAGTQGDIIQYGGYIYLCVVTGVAGAATWAKLTAVNLLA